MKIFSCVFIMIFSTLSYGKSLTKRKIDELERRVSSLENKVEKLKGTHSEVTDLKMKDSEGEIKKFGLERGLASGAPELSKEKQEEIMEQLQTYKKRREESQKILDEIMNDY